jgi:hypothetical protein
MSNEPQWHRFRPGDTVPNPDQRGGSLLTCESVLAVAVKMTNARLNYFLTLGKPFHRKRLDEIAKWVFERATAFSLDGAPEEAEVCYSLSDAADEPYFYEQYLQLVNTRTHMKTDADRDRARAELDTGSHFYFLGSRIQRENARRNYWSIK